MEQFLLVISWTSNNPQNGAAGQTPTEYAASPPAAVGPPTATSCNSSARQPQCQHGDLHAESALLARQARTRAQPRQHGRFAGRDDYGRAGREFALRRNRTAPKVRPTGQAVQRPAARSNPTFPGSPTSRPSVIPAEPVQRHLVGTPHVAGAAALVRGLSAYTPAQIRSFLEGAPSIWAARARTPCTATAGSTSARRQSGRLGQESLPAAGAE